MCGSMHTSQLTLLTVVFFCVKDEVSGASYCDVKELYKLLMQELYSTQGAPLARHQHCILEVSLSFSCLHTYVSLV